MAVTWTTPGVNDMSATRQESLSFGISARRPPNNQMAEQSLLGAVMGNNRALHPILEFLEPEHFSQAVHGRIYRECRRRILAGGVADAISLHTWFASDPDVSIVGGVGYLAQLLSATVGVINAREYGLAIRECWNRRELIDIGEEIVNEAFADQAENSISVVAAAVDRLDALASGTEGQRKATSLDDALDAALAAAERATKGSGPAGISTGMTGVDRAVGGLEGQTLTVLAGRPGMGKSALGWQWAIAAARQLRDAVAAGAPKSGVLVVSLEMSAEQLARRALSAIAQIPLSAIKHGNLSQEDFDRLIRARRELNGLPLSIEDCSGLTVGMIRLKARLARRRHGLGLVVIDHLHIIRPEDADARNGATWAIGRISNALKALAKEFNVPVLALAQLNRGLESREDKRPTLADLRQAGDLEQDADAVCFVYRAEYYLSRSEPERFPSECQQKFSDRCEQVAKARVKLKGKAELLLEKIRDGSPCVVTLHFDAPTTFFTELDP